MKVRLLAIAVAMASLSVVYLIGWSSIFAISTVTIESKDPKNITLIEAELSRSGQEIRVGEPMARINTRAIERTLKNQAWIGEVTIKRDWLSGSVSLLVKERIPLFKVEQFGREIATYGRSFMSSDGELFQLPGNLADDYQSLPSLELQSESIEDRKAAVILFQAIDGKFPVKLMRVNNISRFQSESEVEGRLVRVSWGQGDEIEMKVLVLSKLLNLPANKGAKSFDVSNPELPIVSNR